MKGLVLAYNKDMQEDKEPLFDAFDAVHACTTLMAKLLEGARFDGERMRGALRGDFSTATDLADALAAAGVPFREAHEVVGRLVRHCLASGRILEDLALDDLRSFDSRFAASALKAITPEASADARTSRGGTGSTAVREQILKARMVLAGGPVAVR
jgi:argininosuccinate lyase